MADAESAAESARLAATQADARAAAAEDAKIDLSLQLANLASAAGGDHDSG